MADTRAALAQRGIPLLVTAESGQVLARWDAAMTNGMDRANGTAGETTWSGPATVTTARDGDGDDADGGQ